MYYTNCTISCICIILLLNHVYITKYTNTHVSSLNTGPYLLFISGKKTRHIFKKMVPSNCVSVDEESREFDGEILQNTMRFCIGWKHTQLSLDLLTHLRMVVCLKYQMFRSADN